MPETDQKATIFKQGMALLVDEETDTQLIHHIDGKPTNKLVIGSKGKGKSFTEPQNAKLLGKNQ